MIFFYLKNRFGQSYEDLIEDKAYQLAVSMVILDLGESANKIPEEYLNEHNNIPRSETIGMQNIFAHNYMSINFRDVWDTIETDIPELKALLEELIDE